MAFEKTVQFVGKAQPQQQHELRVGDDAFSFTPLRAESVDVTILEAVAQGLSVTVPNLGPASENIYHSGNRLLLSQCKFAMLAVAAKELVEIEMLLHQGNLTLTK